MIRCTGPEPVDTALSSLDKGAVASVGTAHISGAAVATAASASGVPAAEAAQRLISDALFAAHARESLPRYLVEAAERSALARRLLEELMIDAEAMGLPTEAEIADETARRWWELDRPSAVRTVHVVVRAAHGSADRKAARRLAALLHERLEGLSDAESFMKVAKAADPGKLKVVVERLPAVALDGRVVPDQPPHPGAEPQTLSRRYSEAAHALSKVGDVSGVVDTEFGCHVILLVERVAAKRRSLAERRRLVSEQVVARRAGKAQETLLDRLRERSAVRVSRSAPDAMSQVQVAR